MVAGHVLSLILLLHLLFPVNSIMNRPSSPVYQPTLRANQSDTEDCNKISDAQVDQLDTIVNKTFR